VRNVMPERLIGLSCGTAGEIRDAGGSDVDYLGIGPVFETGSKSDAGRPLGIDGLHGLVSQTQLPVAAIGGITIARLDEIRRSGVAMAAVLSAVTAAQPRTAAERLVSRWSAAG